MAFDAANNPPKPIVLKGKGDLFAAAMAKLDGEITAAHASLGHDPWKAYYNSDGSVGGTLNGGGK